jgi:hypothetical protein
MSSNKTSNESVSNCIDPGTERSIRRLTSHENERIAELAEAALERIDEVRGEE